MKSEAIQVQVLRLHHFDFIQPDFGRVFRIEENMADNTQVSANPTIATDEISGVHYQKVKQVFGASEEAYLVSESDPLPVSAKITNGTIELDLIDVSGVVSAPVAIVDEDGVPLVFSPDKTVTVTPTLDTNAYIAGDVMDGTVLSFADATTSATGSGHILRMTVIDKDDLGASGDFLVHFFGASVTPAPENDAHSLSDTDAGKYIGTIRTTSGTWEDHVNNQTVSVVPTPPIPFSLSSGTTLIGVMVAIDGQTRSASGVVINLYIGGRS